MDPEKIKADRKVAFEIGFARYCYENDIPERLKLAAAAANDGQTKVAVHPALLATLLPSAIAYGGGNAAGQVGGSLYGMASGVSPETVSEREYELAEAATQQLIDELKTKRHNKSIQDILSNSTARRSQHPNLGWAQ